ncbi:uncharacterized protein LOC113146764 [Cyclospora cayetanensis]|uniref:Uncharacterized protein LOC113146764 n=1 Tax=Cyclospora cayetanensis TaxID=88456 RepID=A0A6P6RSQ7_9EIME|nr:uncharacterized protein LOC113146764 [Cyclospora cayetanensis]
MAAPLKRTAWSLGGTQLATAGAYGSANKQQDYILQLDLWDSQFPDYEFGFRAWELVSLQVTRKSLSLKGVHARIPGQSRHLECPDSPSLKPQRQEGQPQKAQMYEQLKQQFLLHNHSKASADTLGLLALWDFCCAHTPPGKDPRDALKPLGLTLCGPFDLLSDPQASFSPSHSRSLYTLPECIPVMRSSSSSSSSSSGSSSTDDSSPLFSLFRDREESSPECVVWNDPGLSGVQTPFAAIDTDLKNAKPSKAKAAAATAAKEDFPHLPLLFAACIRHAVDAAQEASMAGASRGSSQGKQALSRGERELLDFLPIPSASSTNASGSQRLEAIAKRVAKGAAQWAARRKKVCIAKDLSGLGVVVPYDKKADLGWRDLGYSLEGLSKKVRKLKEDGGTRTELEELLTLASIAVDEGDAGAALQLGRNFWCLDALGDKQCFLANPAKRLLGSAYTAMGQPGFAAIVECHAPIRLETLKHHLSPK